MLPRLRRLIFCADNRGAPEKYPIAMPKVTILIPFYNRAAYLHAAIESVLCQTFTDFELLLIDDGSTDDSADVVAGFHDPRIRLLRNETNLGIPATRNRGVAEARGEYLAFLDSDDIALPQRLARQVAFMDKHPEYAATGAWIEWIDTCGTRSGRIKRRSLSPDLIRAERLFRAGLENSTAIARTQILREYPYREDFAVGEDYDLWSRIAERHELAALPQVLVYRREHEQRVTHDERDNSKTWQLQIFAWQLEKLGVSFTQQDLERHHLLRRMQKLDFRPDADYLDWAENWLLGLQSANQATGLYPEPAFSGILGVFWLKACWCAGKTHGRRPWGRFLTSSLRAAARLGIMRYTGQHIMAALPIY